MNGETTSLPNVDSDSSGSDLDMNYYVIRLTSCDKFTQEQLLQFMVLQTQIVKYVIGRETAPQEHYHLVLGSYLDIDEIKKIIRSFIVPLWTENGKCPRGFGNKQYNCQLTIDPDKAVSYALKDHEVVYTYGYDQSYIDERIAASFKKKSVMNFKVEYQQLCEEFQNSDMEIRQFMIKYVTLKAKYGQSVRMIDSYGYANSNLIRREPIQADNLVEDFLYKQ